MLPVPSSLKELTDGRDLGTLNPKHMSEHLASLAKRPGGVALARKAACLYLKIIYSRFLAEDKQDGSAFDASVLDALGTLERKAFDAG